MRRSRLAHMLAIVGLGALWLTGCGQMGPLTRREATAPAQVATPAGGNTQGSTAPGSTAQGSAPDDAEDQDADDPDRDDQADER